MPNIRTWNVTSGQPVQLKRSELSLERELEDWIETEPSLVNPDLVVVGRQMGLNGGKLRLDLLTIDRFGNYWGLIEIKRGRVSSETVTQTIGYCAALNEMSADELSRRVEAYLKQRNTTLKEFLREYDLDSSIFSANNRNLVTYVVGTSRDDYLDSVARYLTSTGAQINIVTFEFFQNDRGDSVLVREMEELENEQSVSTVSPSKPTKTPQAVQGQQTQDEQFQQLFAIAHKNGIGGAYEIIYEAATKHGLVPRTYSQSIMYAPPDDKRRFLIYAPVKKKQGAYGFNFNPEAFAEFYPISYVRAVKILGLVGYFETTTENAQKLANRLDKLFEVIERNRRN